jgi:HEAT repeat protein/uncharacterized RDD family membrane protein YckC
MDEKTRQKAAESILETLLFEIGKVGRIEQFEKKVLHRLCSSLNVSAARFREIRTRVENQLSTDAVQRESFDRDAFFEKLRGITGSIMTREESQFVLRRIGALLDMDVSAIEDVELSGDIHSNLHHPDLGVRYLAIQDLIASDVSEKLPLLYKALEKESDMQLCYEIRKGISELKSISAPVSSDPGDIKESASLQEQLSSKSLEIVKQAAALVVRERKTRHFQAVLDLEKQWDDPFFCACSLRILGMYGNRYLKNIMNYLTHEDPRIVSTCIDVLEQIGGSVALARITVLASHENEKIKSSALRVLGNLSEEQAVAIFEKMADSEYAVYRDAAIAALKELKIAVCTSVLKKLLEDEQESVQNNAEKALEVYAKEGIEAATSILDAYKAGTLDTLANLSRDNSKEVLEAPGLSQDTDSCDEVSIEEQYELFKSHLKQETDPRVIAAAMVSIKDFEDHNEERIALLKHYLESHDDDRVRANALESLGLMLSAGDADYFFRFLQDSCNRVMGNAILALYRLGLVEHYKEGIRSCLLSLLKSASREFQMTAVYCIGNLGDSELFIHLQELCSTTHESVLKEAISCIKQLADAEGQVKDVLQALRQELISREMAEQPAPKKRAKKQRRLYAAGFLARMEAFLLDALICLCLYGFLFILVDASIPNLREFFSGMEYGAMVVWYFLPALFLIAVYSLVLEPGKLLKSTVGKMLMGIQIVTIKEQQKPGALRILLRTCARFLPLILVMIFYLLLPIPVLGGLMLVVGCLPFLIMKTNKLSQGLHDQVAGTEVVRFSQPLWGVWIACLIGTGTVFCGLGFTAAILISGMEAREAGDWLKRVAGEVTGIGVASSGVSQAAVSHDPNEKEKCFEQQLALQAALEMYEMDKGEKLLLKSSDDLALLVRAMYIPEIPQDPGNIAHSSGTNYRSDDEGHVWCIRHGSQSGFIPPEEARPVTHKKAEIKWETDGTVHPDGLYKIKIPSGFQPDENRKQEHVQFFQYPEKSGLAISVAAEPVSSGVTLEGYLEGTMKVMTSGGMYPENVQVEFYENRLEGSSVIARRTFELKGVHGIQSFMLQDGVVYGFDALLFVPDGLAYKDEVMKMCLDWQADS